MFLFVIFIIKNKSLFENKIVAENSTGLTASDSDATVADLVNKSTTGDGIPDWEKELWGLDPTKKDNVPGVPDSVTIAKLKTEQDANDGGAADSTDQNITKTDQFSRDLFATVSTLSENGTLDQNTADQLGSSVASKIQNPVQRKIYTLADINVVNSDTTTTIKKYSAALNSIFPKTQPKQSVIDILQELTADQDNPDISVLPELDPIIEQTNTIIAGMIKMSVPQSLSLLHLGSLNDLEKTVENLNDIQLFNTDPVVALGGISQYQTNAILLTASFESLDNAINKKLNN